MCCRCGCALERTFAAERLRPTAFPSGDKSFQPIALFMVTPIVLAATFVATYLPPPCRTPRSDVRRCATAGLGQWLEQDYHLTRHSCNWPCDSFERTRLGV